MLAKSSLAVRFQ